MNIEFNQSLFIRGSYRVSTRVFAVLLISFVSIFYGSNLSAKVDDSKLLLIINSYHEDELWANKMSRPVEVALSKNDSVRCEKVFLNNSAVYDMEIFNLICDRIFEKYSEHKPDYLVLIGSFAITLRERIKEEWGDIPFILITRVDTFAPVEEYLSNVDENNFSASDQKMLGSLRDKYNFTAVIVPDYDEETINLMMRLQPEMKDFIFVSDKAYVNKVAAVGLQSLLKEHYPDVTFRWLQGSEANGEKLRDLFVKPHPNTGILVSSWVYEVENTRGFKVLTTKDLTYMMESVNPVFSMRQLYMKMGAVGGVFPDNDSVNVKVEELLKTMLNGANMAKIPFYIPEQPQICVDYSLMKKYDLNFNALPKGAVVENSPKTYFEKYGWIAITFIVVCLVIILSISIRNKAQKRQISVLERYKGFISNLPMPYTKAVLWLDSDNNVINISYELKNTSYEALISNNAMPENPLHLFSNTYLSDIANKLLTSKDPVNVRYHFKRTGAFCYFIFVPIEVKELDNTKKQRVKDAKSGVIKKLDVDVFAIDMTKDHHMQQQLKDQAVTIDISMEMAQLVPWQWDAKTDTISFYTYRNYLGNSSTKTRDGKSTSEMKFSDFLKMLPSTDAENLLKEHHKVLLGESSRMDAEFRLYRDDKKNEYDWCENHGVVTDTDSDGRPLRMTGSIQFVTMRKKQEEEMSAALTKAKESDMLKSAFLANMSHEIRTPLNAIVGFSNLLTSTDDINERKEFAEIINRNNELLLSLINDILDLAKIESNTITLTYDLCDIHDVVDSISKTISIRVPKGVKLNVVHYSDACVVKADAAHVSQILINLLTNATKFTKRGSITVGYEVIEDENKLYFYVKDTGIGIKKENIDKVFNRFVKLNNFVQGSGLGLAICRTLVEKMGGEIGVESHGEGRGSMFWFTIPYNPMEIKVESNDAVRDIVHGAVPADHIVGEHNDNPAKIEKKTFEFKTPAEISEDALSAIPDGLTVLVAEDNPSNYWLMARLMQDKFKLFHAENGRIALDMLEEVKPDIIVMDINMPELDGYGAVEEMRKRGVTTPIVAVTAYAFASDRVRILNSGFDAFVSKPVSASILYDTIADVWERKQMKKDEYLKEKEKGNQ